MHLQKTRLDVPGYLLYPAEALHIFDDALTQSARELDVEPELGYDLDCASYKKVATLHTTETPPILYSQVPEPYRHLRLGLYALAFIDSRANPLVLTADIDASSQKCGRFLVSSDLAPLPEQPQQIDHVLLWAGSNASPSQKKLYEVLAVNMQQYIYTLQDPSECTRVINTGVLEFPKMHVEWGVANNNCLG